MRILIVEDEASVATMLQRGLSEQGYEISVAMDGQSAMSMILDHAYDLIILDIMLPLMNGIDILKELQFRKIKVPVIMLTALGATENVIQALNLGADDYLVKPFKFDELLARIGAVSRRATGKVEETTDLYKFADIEVDDAAKTVRRNNIDISLTATEYKLLLYLLKNPKRVLSREQILENVWGIDFDLGTNVVDVYINYLRKKIDKPPLKQVIKTVIGMGYVLRKED